MVHLDEKVEIDSACKDCVALNCSKKTTPGHLPNCPKDPAQGEYLEAFKRRYDGKKKQ